MTRLIWRLRFTARFWRFTGDWKTGWYSSQFTDGWRGACPLEAADENLSYCGEMQ